MRIGTCVYLNAADEMEEKFRKLKDSGFDNCQLLCWKPELFTEETAETVKQAAAKNGITISAFWCGWTGPRVWNFYEGQKTLGLVPAEFREQRVKELKAGGDFALMLGVTDVITHMGFIPEDPNDPNFTAFCDAVREVALHLKKNGQYLLFESGQETPVTMLRCFETVGTDNLAVNLDTANVILYGKANPVDALDVFGKYVRNLHAKDGLYPVNGHDLGEEVQIGTGKVDFPALFRKLKELSYDSFVTIENEIEGSSQDEEILKAREYLYGVLEQ